MKKNILLSALAILAAVLLSSCDSGNTNATSSSPLLGGDRVQESYNGTFSFQDGSSSGTSILNLQDIGGGILQGNIVFNSGAQCLCNATLTGTQVGFNVRLDSGECSAEFIPPFCDTPNADTGLCPIETASGSATYILSGSDATLTGSFTVSGNICQDVYGITNAGTVEFRRR